MSKLIGKDEQAQVWAIPEINTASPKHTTHKDSSLSEREKKAVEEKVNKIRERAYQEGFEKGQQDGLNSGRQQAEQVIHSLMTALNAMSAPLQQVDERLEDELVNLAIAVAKQIVRRELKSDPGQIVAVVREALSIIPSAAQDIHVYLCPEDAARVREVIPAGGGDRNWEIVDDPVLTPGSCRVETDTSMVDATLESRIAAIAAEILGSERADD